MKTYLLLLLGAVWSFQVAGQTVTDSISLGQGYTHQCFYSMANGEVANVSTTDWDLAFDVSGFGSTIRINGAKGTALYLYTSGDSSAWNTTLDTAGISNWQQYDADTSWSLGAFNQSANPNNPVDLGWGTYNTTTHQVNGDSLFVVKLANGAWKKLHIIKLASGTYTFRHADLDGSNLVNASISKSSYSGKNFVYYDIDTDATVDREPAKTDWDIVFTSYVAELFPGTWYGVTGALQNAGVAVAEASPVANPMAYTDYSSHTFETKINTIGYDWKSFNGGTFSFDIADSLAYFVNDVNGSIWRLVFTDFGGSSIGNVEFSKELIAMVNVDRPAATLEAFGLYPNPASQGYVDLVYTSKAANAQVNILAMNGSLVKQQTYEGAGFQQHRISLEGLPAGLYLVSLQAGGETLHRRLNIR